MTRRSRGLGTAALALVVLAAAVSAAGASAGDRGGRGVGTAPPAARDPGAVTVVGSVAGDDWSLPPGTPVAADSGFFSESANPSRHIDTRVVDVT